MTSLVSRKLLQITRSDTVNLRIKKIASLGRQEAQPAGSAKWQTTLRFGEILGTTPVVRSTENPQDVVQKIHRP